MKLKIKRKFHYLFTTNKLHSANLVTVPLTFHVLLSVPAKITGLYQMVRIVQYASYIEY